MPVVDESLVVFTPERAARIAGFTLRQLDYWRKTGLLQPSTDHRISPQRPVRLYSYLDMMSLMVIAELKRHRVSTRRVRMIVDRLRARGYSEPLTQLVFGVTSANSKKVLVAVLHPDGTWEGDTDPGQLMLREAVDLDEIRAAVRRQAGRTRDDAGRIERRAGALGHKPVLAGTRIPVETVRRYIERGVPTEEILEAFPALDESDVEAVRQAS